MFIITAQKGKNLINSYYQLFDEHMFLPCFCTSGQEKPLPFTNCSGVLCSGLTAFALIKQALTKTIDKTPWHVFSIRIDFFC